MDRAQLKPKNKIISAASFPDDDPYQGGFEDDRINQRSNNNFCTNQELVNNKGNGKEDNFNPIETNEKNTASNIHENDNYGCKSNTYQSNSYQSSSNSEKESESTTSSCSLEIQDNSGLGSTRM
jgi:hypothetical protein